MVLLAAGPAAAGNVSEPNGLAVPLNGNNGETELNVFFANQGDAIDWINDAKITPASFYAIACSSFTATYKLDQSANMYGLSWYNETDRGRSECDRPARQWARTSTP
jgi:hypothetical protein